MAFEVLKKDGDKVHTFAMDGYKNKAGKTIPAGDRSFVEIGNTKDGRTKVAPAMATNDTHVLIWK